MSDLKIFALSVVGSLLVVTALIVVSLVCFELRRQSREVRLPLRVVVSEHRRYNVVDANDNVLGAAVDERYAREIQWQIEDELRGLHR